GRELGPGRVRRQSLCASEHGFQAGVRRRRKKEQTSSTRKCFFSPLCSLAGGRFYTTDAAGWSLSGRSLSRITRRAWRGRRGRGRIDDSPVLSPPPLITRRVFCWPCLSFLSLASGSGGRPSIAGRPKPRVFFVEVRPTQNTP
ncbi:unnamed protein product, partial [Scytosiphon promiscuus]